jgi:hypothetical protein
MLCLEASTRGIRNRPLKLQLRPNCGAGAACDRSAQLDAKHRLAADCALLRHLRVDGVFPQSATRCDAVLYCGSVQP